VLVEQDLQMAVIPYFLQLLLLVAEKAVKGLPLLALVVLVVVGVVQAVLWVLEIPHQFLQAKEMQVD
jgi:hypothetical protein